jgi:hypothetical protein
MSVVDLCWFYLKHCSQAGTTISHMRIARNPFMECTGVRAKNLPDARGIPTYFALRVRGSLKRSDFSTALLHPDRDTRRRKKDCSASQSCLCSDRNTHRSLSRRIGAQRRGVSGFLRLPGLTLISSHRASTGSAEARGVFTRSRQIPPEAAPNSSNAKDRIGRSGENLAKSPIRKSEAESSMLMGEIVKSGLSPKPFEPDPKLEAALGRLLQGIRQSRGG